MTLMRRTKIGNVLFLIDIDWKIMYLGSLSGKTRNKGCAETRINVVEAPSGLRLRKEQEGELEARWNDLPPHKSLGFYEVQIGRVSGNAQIKVDWGESVKLDMNRKIFAGLNPGCYTFRVRTITPTPLADRNGFINLMKPI